MNGSLSELETIDLKGCPIAAVPDISAERYTELNARLSLPLNNLYFNSGVLLIDLKMWADDDMTTQTLAYAEANPERLGFMDQDVLNAMFAGRCLQLDPTWNRHATALHLANSAHLFRASKIIHFLGKLKPFFTDCPHPARDLYLKHRAKTAWAGRRLKTPFERKLRLLRFKAVKEIAKPLKWMKSVAMTAIGRRNQGSVTRSFEDG